MSWTHEQKMAATLISLNGYKNTLPPGDPDLAKAQEHVDWRNARIAWNDADKLSMKAGPGSNPSGTPPPPPLP